MVMNSNLYSIERRFSCILCLNRVEADNTAIIVFSYLKLKNKWLNYIYNYSSEELLSILIKKTLKAEFTTKISREDFEIQDHFDYLYL